MYFCLFVCFESSVTLFYLSCLFSAVDLDYGMVYCFACRSFVYDEELELVAKEQTNSAAVSLGITLTGNHIYTCSVLHAFVHFSMVFFLSLCNG